MKNLLLIITIMLLTFAAGCALLAHPIAEKVATVVEKYCEEPLSYRQLYRNTVNSHLTATGHVVHVHCSGDPGPVP